MKNKIGVYISEYIFYSKLVVSLSLHAFFFLNLLVVYNPIGFPRQT